MTESWNYFTELDEEQFGNIDSLNLLPLSLKDVLIDVPNNNTMKVPNNAINQSSIHYPEFVNDNTHNENQKHQINVEFNNKRNKSIYNYCLIQFHKNRIGIFSFLQSMNINVGDYVITDADRGFDIGLVISIIQNPTAREVKTSKSVKRKATNEEINNIPVKIENENKALEICQKKVEELNLPMRITGAEYQFDGKKLTFYYTASKYVDFRNLVRTLFHVFSTRIWMIWHDGTAPVKDVFTRNEEKQHF